MASMGLALACASAVHAQSPRVAGDTGWVQLTGPGVPAPYYLYTQAGTAAGTAPANFTSLSPNKFGVARAGVSGGVRQDNQAPADKSTYSVRYDRVFKLLDNADLSLSNIFTAELRFGGAGNTNKASASAVMVLYQEKTAGAGDWELANFDANVEIFGDGTNKSITDKFNVATKTLAASDRRYFLRAEVYSSAESVAGSGLDTTAISDSRTFGGARAGMSASMALTTPNNTFNSRAAAKLDAARRYGLTGKGVRIGMIEPGNPYAGDLIHKDLEGRVGTVNGVVEGQMADEHATAVAGILAGANADLAKQGFAPKATVVSAALSSYDSTRDLLTRVINTGATVINMSAGTPLEAAPDVWFNRRRIDEKLSDNPQVSFVVSAGNDGSPAGPGSNTVSNEGGSLNGISVGALNRTGTARADFSSFSLLENSQKPDIVAPGEEVLAMSARDTDGVGGVNEYRRHFLGSDFDHKAGASATSGAISGTSFAAPMVAGSVALMQEYAAMANQTHDARASDSRVLKAVLLNSADRSVKESGGAAWRQYTDKVEVDGKEATRVWRSLNAELGAGALDLERTMYTFATPEARRADDAAGRNITIDLATNNGKLERDRYWDLQRINAPVAEPNGWATVDYLLGDLPGGITFTSTLCWHSQLRVVNNSYLEQTPVLNLLLFEEGTDDGNLPGWEQANPLADTLIAFTEDQGGTVRLMNLLLDNPGRYYLQVRSQFILDPLFFRRDFDFGLSFTVPTPSGGMVVCTMLLAAARRRRRINAESASAVGTG